MCKEFCYLCCSCIFKVKQSYHWFSSAVLLSKMKSLFFSLWTKNRQIHWKHVIFWIHVIFESTSQFSFRVGSQLNCSQLNCKFLGFSSARVKVCQNPYVNFEHWGVNLSSNFASFYIFMTHNFPLNFKLIHFLLWANGSHQSPNFEAFDSALVKICQIPHVIFENTTHPATRRHSNVVMTSLYMSQQRRRHVSNETPNDILIEHQQDLSVVRPHDALLEPLNDVSRGRIIDIPSVCLHEVSNKYHKKHPTTSQWYVVKTSRWYILTTSH